MFKLFKYVKKYIGLLVVSILISLSSMGISLLLPRLSGDLVNNMDKFIMSGDVSSVWAAGRVMILLSVISGIFSILSSFFMSRVSAGLGKELRRAMFYKAETLSQRDIDKIGVPSLITRTTNDISSIQSFILSTISTVFTGPVMAVFGLVLAVSINPKMSGLVLAVVLGLFVLFIPFIVFVILPMTKKSKKLSDKLNKVMREKMSGIRVIRAFNRTKYENERFEKTNYDLTAISLKLSRIMSLLIPFLTVAVFGIVLFLVSILIKDINAWDITNPEYVSRIENIKGDIMMFFSYIILAIGGIGSIAGVLASIPTAKVSANRVNELLDMQPSVEDGTYTEENFETHGSVEFKDVTFAYEVIKHDEDKKKKHKRRFKIPSQDSALQSEENNRQNALENVSFEISKGETLGIIGGTGSGKSTVAELIQRFYDVSSGDIFINGINIKDISFKTLRQVLGVATQETFLFSGTIEENLKYGKEDATEEEMWYALKIAQADDFVRALPDGLKSKVSQRGKNFSGGQRQRLAIARAVIRDAEIFVFDDSFSALDFKTDANLRKAIRESMSSATMVIIAQRIGTIINADKIVVLDEGKVVGMGTHNYLLETCEKYQEIAKSQLEKGDAENE